MKNTNILIYERVNIPIFHIMTSKIMSSGINIYVNIHINIVISLPKNININMSINISILYIRISLNRSIISKIKIRI